MRKGARATHTRDTTGGSQRQEFGEERLEFLQITHVRGPLPTTTYEFATAHKSINNQVWGGNTVWSQSDILQYLLAGRHTRIQTHRTHAYFSSADSAQCPCIRLT